MVLKGAYLVIGINNMNDIPTIESMLACPTTSNWLRGALTSAKDRDPCDSLGDAKFLVMILTARLAKLQAPRGGIKT